MRGARLGSAVLAVASAVAGLTGCLDPTSARPPAAGTAGVPAYRSSIATVTAADLGTSWRAGCPVGPADLRRVTVAYWGYDGEAHRGDLIVHRTVAADVAGAFGDLYDARFQIRRIHPVDAYGSDDDASMAANNTSAFNCRRVAGSSSWSEHAYGTAIDLNPVQNPYVTASGSIEPPEGKPWADRSVRVPGMIHAGEAVDDAFAAIGWGWGGRWSSAKDYQHLSRSGR
jgi:hypothetical protein